MGTTADSEIELKLHVPATAVAAVEKALHDRTRAHTIHLRAAYFDTPDQALARAGLAWRVRRESNRWVQTLKGAAPRGDGLVREEHNVVVHGKGWPAPDPSLFAGTPAGDRLAAVLASLAPPTTSTGKSHRAKADANVGAKADGKGDGKVAAAASVPAERFRTDIRRVERTQKVAGGTVVFAFDRGTIAAPDGRTTEVCELEVELGSGSPQAVIATARRWVARHGLWLDTVNKALRGSLLADGNTTAPVARGAKPQLTADMSLDAALREITRACLAPTMRNVSALANGMGTPEHVHMARVSLRKLRSALRELGPLSPAVDPAWADRIGEQFARFGAARDRDVVALLLPSIQAAGGPDFELPEPVHTDPADVARDPALSLLMLDLMAYAYGPADTADTTATSKNDGKSDGKGEADGAEGEQGERSLARVVAGELKRLHRDTLRHHDGFTSLTEADQHRTRKQLKRLRYLAELTAALYPAKEVRRYVKALSPAQDALGALNDLVVARDTFAAAATAGQPEAWFAAGWAAAQLPAAAAACVRPLALAADAPRYWRGVGSRRAAR